MVSYLFEEGDKFLFFYVTKINFRVASFSNMTDKQATNGLYCILWVGVSVIEVSIELVSPAHPKTPSGPLG